MKNYHRAHPSFALCGLNCALCPIHNMKNGCPGCGGGEGHQSCKIIRCSMEHETGKETMEFCSQCPEFPCRRLEECIENDSFLSHRNMISDLKRGKETGMDFFLEELEEKAAILRELLENYNDGRKKTLFCLAASLLSLSDLRQTFQSLPEEIPQDASLKEKAAAAARLFQAMAGSRGIELKLRKKK